MKIHPTADALSQPAQIPSGFAENAPRLERQPLACSRTGLFLLRLLALS